MYASTTMSPALSEWRDKVKSRIETKSTSNPGGGWKLTVFGPSDAVNPESQLNKLTLADTFVYYASDSDEEFKQMSCLLNHFGDPTNGAGNFAKEFRQEVNHAKLRGHSFMIDWAKASEYFADSTGIEHKQHFKQLKRSSADITQVLKSLHSIPELQNVLTDSGYDAYSCQNISMFALSRASPISANTNQKS